QRELAVVRPFTQDVPALLGDYVPPLRENAAHSSAASLQKALRATRVSASEEPQPQELAHADAVVAGSGGTRHRSYDDSFAANGAIQGRSGAATCGEGVDLADLTLPAQEAMIRRLRELLPPHVPIVVVVVAGRPHVLTGIVEIADAVLWAGYPGPHGAEAIAATLLGRAEPTGRLPMTMPRHSGVVPVRYNDRHSAAGVYRDADEPVLFESGHGLTYHSVDITGLNVHVDDERVNVHIAVHNAADTPAEAILPVFATRRGGTAIPRMAELIGFERIDLGAGQHMDLMLPLPPERVFTQPGDPGSITEIHVEGRRQEIRPA